MPQVSVIFVIVWGIWGSIISALTAFYYYQSEDMVAEKEFEQEISEVASNLKIQINLHFESLYALESLFTSDDYSPSYDEFSNIATKIIQRHSGIQALEWIPRVPHSERASFEEKMHAHFPDFNITEKLESGAIVTAKERPFYYPVAYLEPVESNQAAIGFDLASNKPRKRTLSDAIRFKTLRSTPSIQLVQETEEQKGFLTFLPVFKENADIKGFVLGVYRIPDLIRKAFTPTENFQLSIHDLSLDSTKELLYENLLSNPIHDTIQSSAFTLDVGGRTWVIKGRPSYEYIQDKHSQIHWIIFTAGISLTIMMLGFYMLFIKKE